MVGRLGLCVGFQGGAHLARPQRGLPVRGRREVGHGAGQAIIAAERAPRGEGEGRLLLRGGGAVHGQRVLRGPPAQGHEERRLLPGVRAHQGDQVGQRECLEAARGHAALLQLRVQRLRRVRLLLLLLLRGRRQGVRLLRVRQARCQWVCSTYSVS